MRFSGSSFRVSGSGSLHGLRFRVYGLWFVVYGLGCRVWELGFRVSGIGFTEEELWVRFYG